MTIPKSMSAGEVTIESCRLILQYQKYLRQHSVYTMVSRLSIQLMVRRSLLTMFFLLLRNMVQEL